MTIMPAVALVARFSTLVGGRVVGAAAMFLINLIVARHFGAEAYGVFALFVAAVSILGICLPAGYNAVATLFAAEYAATGRMGHLNGFVRAALITVVVVSICTVLLGAAYLFGFHNGNRNDALLVYSLVGLGGLAFAGLNLSGSLMVGLKHQIAGMMPETFLRPMLLLVGVFALTRLTPDVQIAAILILHAAVTWFSLGVAGILSWGPLRSASRTKPEYETVRWRKAAFPWMAITLSWDFLIDVLILTAGLVAGSAEIALLHVCFRFRVLAGYAMRCIYMLLIPDITAAKATGRMAEMRARIGQANLLSVVFAAGVMVIFAITGPYLLGLFGEEMVAGMPMLLAVSSTLLIRAIFGPAPAVLAIHDLHNASAAIMIAGLAVAVVLALGLYPFLGILGVAVAYPIANLGVSIALWRYAEIKTGIDVSIFSVFRFSGPMRHAESRSSS